jgi:hypothetical protein
MRVDVILVFGDTEALAVKRAKTTKPIIAVAIGDPVSNGLVETLARPAGNVTGLSLALSETAGKRLELLREVVPGLKSVAIFGNSGNPLVETERNAAIAAAHTLGLDTVRRMRELEPANLAPEIDPRRSGGSAGEVCFARRRISRIFLGMALAAHISSRTFDRLNPSNSGWRK